MRNLGMLAAFVLLSSACGSSSKADKTCEGPAIDADGLPPHWKELGVARGDICRADDAFLIFLVENSGSAMDVAKQLAAPLRANGWVEVEPGEPSVVGEGDGAMSMVDRWLLSKGTSTLRFTIESFPRSHWNDDPIQVKVNREIAP